MGAADAPDRRASEMDEVLVEVDLDGGPVTRVLICDEHALFRRALLTVLEREHDLEVVAEASSGQEAVMAARDLTPDVALVDVTLPPEPVSATVAAINEQVPSCRVLLLSVDFESDQLISGLRAGARGHLLKELAFDQVPGAVRDAMAGRAVVSCPLASRILAEVAVATGPADSFTERDRHVMARLAEGVPTAQIAEDLGVGPRTVENAVLNVLAKLQLNTRVQGINPG